MKLRTIIILSILLIGCVVYVALQRLTPKGGGAAEVFDAPVLGASEATVEAIRITSANGDSVRLERTEAGWRVTEPYQARADRAAADSIAGALATARFVRQVDDDTQLETPTWRVDVALAGGRNVQLTIGDSESIIGGDAVAAPLRSSAHPGRVGLVEVDFDALFNRPAAAYCSQRLVVAQPTEITSVEFEGRESFTLSRVDGRWQIDSATFSDSTDGEATYAFLRSLLLLYAQNRRLGGDMAAMGLTPETARLSLRLTCDSERSIVDDEVNILIGDVTESGQHYAAIVGTEVYFLVDARDVESLQISADDLRERRFVTFDPATVVAAEITLPDTDAPVTLSRQAEQWTMSSPLTGPADAPSIESLLVALNTLEATGFYDELPMAGAGLESPVASISLSLLGRDEPLVLSIGDNAPDGTGVFVSCSDRPRVVTIANDVARAITVGARRYYSHELFALPAGHEVRRIVVARPEGRTVTLRPEGNHWQRVGSESGRADDDAVAALLAELTSMRATQLVSIEETVPPAYLDQRNTVLVTVTTAPVGGTEETVRMIRLVHPRDGVGQSLGYFAFTPAASPAIVGRIDEAVYAAATASFASRTIWSFDPAEIREIRITQGAAEPLVLTQLEGQWHIEDEPYARVNQSFVTRYLIGAKTLHTSSYTDHGTDHLDVYELHIPWVRVEFVDTAGESYEVSISRIGPTSGPSPRYATAPGVDVIFLMDGNSIERFVHGREEFLADTQ